MPFNNPNIDDIQLLVQAEMSQILSHVGSHTGQKIGHLQRQLNNLAGLDLAQITTLQAQVQQLASLLDGDPTQPGYQNLQALMGLLDRVVDLEAWKATVDSRLTNSEDALDGIDTRIAAAEVAVADAASDAASAVSTANAAQLAVSLLDQREDSRHGGHENKIGMLRSQVYQQNVGLAIVAIAAFSDAFNTAEAAALLP